MVKMVNTVSHLRTMSMSLTFYRDQLRDFARTDWGSCGALLLVSDDA